MIILSLNSKPIYYLLINLLILFVRSIRYNNKLSFFSKYNKSYFLQNQNY